MNGTLKVTATDLTTAAGEFQNTASLVKNLTAQMPQTVNQLSGQVWSGDAANKYKQKFNGLQDDISRMYKYITDHVTDLNEMARSYSSVEAENVSAAGALSDDVVK